MTRFIAIMSGKGGVGKTTISLNLGMALNNIGKEVIVLDGNLTSPNIGLYLGVSKMPNSLHDAFDKDENVYDAIYRHTSGLKIIPGDISLNALNKINIKKIKNILSRLNGSTEIILIDSSAGLHSENMAILNHADELLVVTTPDLMSITESLKTIKLAEAKNTTVLGIVLNRTTDNISEISTANIESLLGYPVLVSIVEDVEIKKSQSIKNPIVYTHPNSESSGKFKKLAAMLIGQKYESDITEQSPKFYDEIIKRLSSR